MEDRHFLFLQGPTSPFFCRLGDKLLELGARVSRINFNMGDAAYWRKKPAWNFRQSVEYLPTYLERIAVDEKVTDIIMVGDTRPVNAPAVPMAKRLGIRLHVVEEGYLRPNFLTLEEGGINGYSSLPRDAEWYRRVGPTLPPLPQTEPVRSPVVLLGLHEIGYHLPGILNPIFYSGYKTHRPYVSGVELAGWALRFSKMPFYERRDAERIERLVESGTPYYILPLQLDCDSQIQVHSDIASMSALIEMTMRSFARHAPHKAKLIIKNHPLDTGFVNFRKLTEKLAHKLGIDDRTLYLESGHLPTLLDHCDGVIVVNSTVGTSALIHGCKTIALSTPIYDLEDLTFRGSLDAFWQADHSPDMELLENFRRVVVHTTQINGGFYSKSGIAIAVASAVQRFEHSQSLLEQLLNNYPISGPSRSDR